MTEKSLAHTCLVCGTTLDGPLGLLFHMFGITRSLRNPNVCNRCDAHLQEGRIIEMSVLFADLTAFTEMTHRLGAERSYQVVDSFFKMANDVLVKHDAFIDKYIGDAVMAIFNAPIRNTEHAHAAASAAVDIQAGLSSLRAKLDLDLQARIGVASGYARVGRVGSDDRKDYTAIGDVVNLAARLESQARPGEVLVDRQVYAAITQIYPAIPAETLNIRGFPEPIEAYRIQENQQAAHEIGSDQPEPARQRQTIGFGAVVFAILGAPCAAASLLGPLSLVLGFGVLMGSLGPVLNTLDSDIFRLPLQAFAILGATLNLYVIWYGNRQRQLSNESGSGVLELTRLEQRKVWLVAGLSVFSLLVVAAEWYAHLFIMGNAAF